MSGRQMKVSEANGDLGPPLKIILFPVHRPGELISGKLVRFFSHFRDLFFSDFSILFLYSVKNILKKKRFCGLPTGHHLWPPAGQETTFFFRVAWRLYRAGPVSNPVMAPAD